LLLAGPAPQGSPEARDEVISRSDWKPGSPTISEEALRKEQRERWGAKQGR